MTSPEDEEPLSSRSFQPKTVSTGELIDHFVRMGFEFVDVLKILGLEHHTSAPRNAIEISEWLGHEQSIDSAADHGSFDANFGE